MKEAITSVARAYGLRCTVEPDFYTYTEVGKDGMEMELKRRPDITFFTNPPVATDVTIVYPGVEPDLEATKAAVRRHVSTFQNLRYYCKTPFLFLATDGTKYYAKYRAIPFRSGDLPIA